MPWHCLAPDCDETGDDLQSRIQHKHTSDHPDHGEVWR